MPGVKERGMRAPLESIVCSILLAAWILNRALNGRTNDAAVRPKRAHKVHSVPTNLFICPFDRRTDGRSLTAKPVDSSVSAVGRLYVVIEDVCKIGTCLSAIKIGKRKVLLRADCRSIIKERGNIFATAAQVFGRRRAVRSDHPTPTSVSPQCPIAAVSGWSTARRRTRTV